MEATNVENNELLVVIVSIEVVSLAAAVAFAG